MKKLLSLASVTLALIPAAGVAKITPEQEAKRLGQILKPIPDEVWMTAAGERVSEKYSVTSGDTLFDISKRLFGDPKYWPKVWAINNNTIANPHQIKPGMMIAFMPGTSSSLPSVGMAEGDEGFRSDAYGGLGSGSAESQATTPDGSPRKKRSDEWKRLPQQPWELIRLQLPPEIDPQGFDRRSKITFKTITDFELESVVTSDALDPVGYIRGSLTEATEIFQGSLVFIEAEANIHVGEVYSLTEDPFILNRQGARQGYAYSSVGKVVVTGVQDGVFIGNIINARSPIGRQTFLMPVPPKAKLIDPIPGPSQMEAVIHFDTRFSTQYASQYRQVFVDLGSEDGVQAGMIFRAYETKDPVNGKKVAPEGFVPLADMMVVQVSPRFSSGILLSTPNLVADKTPVTLLTDVSDVGKAWKPKSAPESDELEKLDPGSELGAEEEKELIQLERHQDEPSPSETSAAPETGDDDPVALPPPPEEDSGMSAGPVPTAPETEPAITPDVPSDLPPPPPPELSPDGSDGIETLPPPPTTSDAGAVEFPPPPELE
ncbi:MAG TPA: hypothetical protein DCS07_17430 [Bdellovibrionales bacterium]|nr:MAG: hypothetical protein A2Z97_07680 [Bdellovibrionales bacterium GWB1_52_6]OFZ04759.1 MAG: hypothetical protein A2X97_13620 [Bdellovibrionales bacterium GWA1_52_35]OFZ38166.1 MAG: hypothetical protein A2070_01245 [Bdellovibrionales bacterium GWC1_52_8]HAR44383.1 hypothetical protein [Bdellovibrionales bacterium]HCM39573.1 hypothetical protein [Bdellovibrionales bacterium]